MSTTLQKITQVIKKLGVPANLNGYHHIRYCVELILKDPKHTVPTMNLYYDSAEKFGVTTTAVERGVRTAINTSRKRTDEEFFKELFGYNASDVMPTNSEYIATIADYVLTQLDNNDEEEN